MAHSKRKSPRTSASKGYSAHGLARRIKSDDYKWFSNYPRWWDKVYHTGPARAQSRALERRVLRGDDPDNMTWLTNHKPHIYYW